VCISLCLFSQKMGLIVFLSDEFGVHLDENSISLLLGDNAELGTLLAIATKSASNDQNI